MEISKIGGGDFADVFDLGDGTVLKAFKRQQHTGGDVGNWCDEDSLTRELCEAEVRAYEDLRKCPHLAIFTPEFFGRLDPHDALKSEDLQRTAYVKGCGFQIEKIPGTDVKFARLEERLKDEALNILERIEAEIKPGNVWDSSCFTPGTRAKFTFIDFAVWDDLLNCAEILGNQGQFTDRQREQLRLEHRIDCD